MNNNPVSRVDPLGDNDYKVNEKGEITLVKETKDETDRLIAVSGKKEKIEYKKDGTLKNASITLDKGIIAGRTELQQEVTGDGGKETVNYMRLDFGKNEEAAQKTFEFLANNTGVEWSLVTAGYKFEGEPEGTTSSIYTSHKEDKEYFGGQAALDKASNAGTWLNRLEHTHNHPRAFGEDDLRGEHSAADGDFRTKVTQKFPGTKVFIFENGTRYEYTQYQNKKKKN
jgi:hypothetical protein